MPIKDVIAEFDTNAHYEPCALLENLHCRLKLGARVKYAFFDCSKSGRRSVVLAMERFDDFRRAILVASHAAVSMVGRLGG